MINILCIIFMKQENYESYVQNFERLEQKRKNGFLVNISDSLKVPWKIGSTTPPPTKFF